MKYGAPQQMLQRNKHIFSHAAPQGQELLCDAQKIFMTGQNKDEINSAAWVVSIVLT
jgi:hypothetical protein